jgi:hypothetical protein
MSISRREFESHRIHFSGSILLCNGWMRSKRIKEQLGMSQGAANHLLRRNLLYKLAARCNMLECFVCELPIEIPEELSVEHKKPWENRSADLFWDLDNLAFSHRRCNRNRSCGAGPKGRAKQKGYAWCAGCEEELPHASFSFRTRESGNKTPRAYCKSCRVERKRMGLPA